MIFTQSLSYQYASGPLLVFDDIDAPQGTVLLLSGASGSGKSTWLALVAALIRPKSGTLRVAGQSLEKLQPVAADAWRASHVGFLPQKLHLSAALSVHQNLAMAQWAANVPQDDGRIVATLRSLGVEALAQRKPGQLSGGQAQRVALARAVLLHPSIILADEPTASLDDQSAANAVDLLHSTARMQNATLVIATHDARVPDLLSQHGAGAFARLKCRPITQPSSP